MKEIENDFKMFISSTYALINDFIWIEYQNEWFLCDLRKFRSIERS